MGHKTLAHVFVNIMQKEKILQKRFNVIFKFLLEIKYMNFCNSFMFSTPQISWSTLKNLVHSWIKRSLEISSYLTFYDICQNFTWLCALFSNLSHNKRMAVTFMEKKCTDRLEMLDVDDLTYDPRFYQLFDDNGLRRVSQDVADRHEDVVSFSSLRNSKTIIRGHLGNKFNNYSSDDTHVKGTFCGVFFAILVQITILYKFPCIVKLIILFSHSSKKRLIS